MARISLHSSPHYSRRRLARIAHRSCWPGPRVSLSVLPHNPCPAPLSATSEHHPLHQQKLVASRRCTNSPPTQAQVFRTTSRISSATPCRPFRSEVHSMPQTARPQARHTASLSISSNIVQPRHDLRSESCWWPWPAAHHGLRMHFSVFGRLPPAILSNFPMCPPL